MGPDVEILGCFGVVCRGNRAGFKVSKMNVRELIQL